MIPERKTAGTMIYVICYPEISSYIDLGLTKPTIQSIIAVMKVKIEIEFDTKEDQDELEELIERLQALREMLAEDQDDA